MCIFFSTVMNITFLNRPFFLTSLKNIVVHSSLNNSKMITFFNKLKNIKSKDITHRKQINNL